MLQQVDLQHTVVHCNTLQHPATPCNILEHTCNIHAIHVRHTRICCCKSPCKTLQRMQQTATHCNTLQHSGTHCNILEHTCITHARAATSRSATQCTTLQRTATHCNTLQRTATYCNTLQHTAIHMQHTCITHASHMHMLQQVDLQHTATHCNTTQHTYNTTHMQHTCITHAHAAASRPATFLQSNCVVLNLRRLCTPHLRYLTSQCTHIHSKSACNFSAEQLGGAKFKVFICVYVCMCVYMNVYTCRCDVCVCV